jgi:sporulation protein YlmC with PRC-barrel domain
MIRTLLTTTAVAVLMGTAAFAQATPAPAPVPADAPAAVTAPGAAPAGEVAAPLDTGAAQNVDVNEPWDMSQGYVVADTDNLGTRLIGQTVYSSTGDDAEEIGTINDIVFDADGQITAVVIGVGGFLGIGEKNVAVDFDSLEFTLAADNTERWVVPTTADALTAAPDFVWKEDEPADANNDAMAPADGGAMAPVDGGAMAPAPAVQ